MEIKKKNEIKGYSEIFAGTIFILLIAFLILKSQYNW